MVILPVLGLSAMPAGHVPNCDTVAFVEAPTSVIGDPFAVSLEVITLSTVDGTPEMPEPDSAIGRMAAFTLMVAVALAQFTGVFVSQSRYCTL